MKLEDSFTITLANDIDIICIDTSYSSSLIYTKYVNNAYDSTHITSLLYRDHMKLPFIFRVHSQKHKLKKKKKIPLLTK